MRIASWNINGLRASLKTGDFQKWLSETSPDIVGLQEVKATPDQVDESAWRGLGYECWWHPAEKPGYSGALLLAKTRPHAVILGLGDPRFDAEGRVIQADFGTFMFLTAYFPNSGRGEDRVRYKVEFNQAFITRCDDLVRAGRNVVFVGDLNAAHTEADLARPEENRTVAGFLPIEREWVGRFIEHGWIDTFRAFYPSVHDAYTYWDAWRDRRARNVGWRIDYVWVNAGFLPAVKDSYIQAAYMGSDHCPVGAELDVAVEPPPGDDVVPVIAASAGATLVGEPGAAASRPARLPGFES